MLKVFKLLATSITVTFLFSCTHNQIKESLNRNLSSESSTAPIHELEKPVVQLTFHGDNSQPSFSPDGKKFLYVSKNRYRHSNPQVYEFDLSNKEENRLIFQDGITASPIYDDFGQSIIFASTTDEIKENPLYIYNKLYSMNVEKGRGIASASIIQSDEIHAFELYKKNLFDDVFLRLTHSKRLDNNMSYYKNKRKNRLFTSVRHGNLEIYKYRNHVPKSPTRLTFSDFIDDEPELSPTNNDYIWIRYGDQSLYSQILFGNIYNRKLVKELTFGKQFHINPVWHPDGEYIYFSATQPEHKNYQLYVINKDGTCKTRVTHNEYKDFQPTIDPKGDSIVFSRTKGNVTQIYKTKLRKPECKG